ncbi:MAG TPA: SDR family oxidoreductase [Polyangiaceae bacterium]
MPRTAFVTGGTGFLGRHIIEQLTSLGWRVVALRRPSSEVKHLRAYPGVELVVGSITDAKSLARAMPDGCDAVFHVAGNTSLWSGGDAEQTRDNVDGTRNMVETALAKKARRFVHTSSVAAFGDQEHVPFDETATSHAPASRINYERTKYAGELEVDRGVKAGLEGVIMNPGHIVGKYDTGGWARMIRMVAAGKLPGVPPGAGSWAHATQVARAHIAAVDRGRVGERYLLGGVDATFLEMVTIIGRLTGKKVPTGTMPGWIIRALGRVSQWGSYVTKRAPRVTPEIASATARPPHIFKSDKAIQELGYEAVPLEDMLRESYEWLRGEGLVA